MGDGLRDGVGVGVGSVPVGGGVGPLVAVGLGDFVGVGVGCVPVGVGVGFGLPVG